MLGLQRSSIRETLRGAELRRLQRILQKKRPEEHAIYVQEREPVRGRPDEAEPVSTLPLQEVSVGEDEQGG